MWRSSGAHRVKCVEDVWIFSSLIPNRDLLCRFFNAWNNVVALWAADPVEQWERMRNLNRQSLKWTKNDLVVPLKPMMLPSLTIPEVSFRETGLQFSQTVSVLRVDWAWCWPLSILSTDSPQWNLCQPSNALLLFQNKAAALQPAVWF